MVAPFVIRRRFCYTTVTIRHRSADHRRSGTLCVLRIASSLSWVLSAQLTTLQYWGREFSCSSESIFWLWLNHTSVITECAANPPDIFFWKKDALTKALQPSFFEKRPGEPGSSYLILYVQLSTARWSVVPYSDKQKTHLGRTEVRWFIEKTLTKSLWTVIISVQNDFLLRRLRSANSVLF